MTESKKLLNNHPVLDKGNVALLSSSNGGRALSDIQSMFLDNSVDLELLRIANATFVIKMPLFVQLHMSKYNLVLIQSHRLKKIETYVPNVAEIGGNSVKDAAEIHDYMKQTADAMTLNTKGLTMAGCDEFIAQTQTPISVYNELIVHGSLHEWLKFIKQKNLPKSIESFRYTIEEILKADWPNINQLKKMA
jgi:hypothetical protein